MEKPEEITVTTRLRQFIDHLGLSNSQFADKAGIPRPTLSQLIHGRNKSVNDLLLRKLHENFPALNISWLLFGVGNMTENANIQFSEAQNKPKSNKTEIQNPESQEDTTLFSHNSNIEADSAKQIFEPENSDLGIFGALAEDLQASQASNGIRNSPHLLQAKKSNPSSCCIPTAASRYFHRISPKANLQFHYSLS